MAFHTISRISTQVSIEDKTESKRTSTRTRHQKMHCLDICYEAVRTRSNRRGRKLKKMQATKIDVPQVVRSKSTDMKLYQEQYILYDGQSSRDEVCRNTPIFLSRVRTLRNLPPFRTKLRFQILVSHLFPAEYRIPIIIIEPIHIGPLKSYSYPSNHLCIRSGSRQSKITTSIKRSRPPKRKTLRIPPHDHDLVSTKYLITLYLLLSFYMYYTL